MTLRGIIFDMDGTLVDSGLDFDAIRRDIGLPERHPILEGVEAIPAGPGRDRAFEILHRHEHDGARRATPYPGVADLLGRLETLALRRGVLTRNSRVSAKTTFDRLGWTFDSVLTREDAPAKPDPTGVLAICDDWNLPPADVLFVGDYLFDLQAGHNAGTKAALFAPGVLPEWADLADWVVSSFGELEELIERLCLEA
jgi:HAD superfamily hydrolase (TIGR01509 family)